MRWQKAARLAIAAFVIVFAAVVVVALRRPAAPVARPTTPRTDPNTIAETHGKSTARETGPDGKIAYTLDFEGQLTYPDGRNVFKNATLTLPDRNGRSITVTGAQMEVNVPQEGGGRLTTATMSSGTRLITSDGLEVRSDRATFDEKSGMLSVPGEVQFTRGRLTGSGHGATYDRDRDVLWLLDRAVITVQPDEKGQGAMTATAGAAGLARADHYVRLTRGAHVVGDGRTMDAQELTIQLTDDDRFVKEVALRGDSRITGSPGGTGPDGMSARDIDLSYAPDGRTLQTAKLMEKAEARLPGTAGQPPRTITARMMDIAMGPDGSTVTRLNATENVVVEIPAAQGAPARRITAAGLSAGGETSLQTATFTGAVDYREMRAAGRNTEAGERTARAQQLVVRTQPGLGAFEEADFRGNVTIVDGATTAEGPRALYRVAKDEFEISPEAGVPGPPPSVNDGRVLVNARTIRVTISSRTLKAETDVRSSIHPKKDEPTPGRKARAAAETRLPSMLNQKEPVNVTGNRLDYDGAAGTALYDGDARLFQGQPSFQADSILLEDRTANLTAKGRVRSVMFLDELDAKTKTTRSVQTTATGHEMVYEDAKRLATYTSGPTARAHIVGTQGDVTADRIQLFLKAGANELERAEADGTVTVKEGNRTATGAHLTYTTADESYVMQGEPVEVEEKTPTECRITVAARLTFYRSSVTTLIQNNPPSPITTKPCVAGPAR
jgi:lipopolysaccharide export system protein LptA